MLNYQRVMTVTVRDIENGPVEIVDLPIDSMVDRSTSQTVNVYQRLPASHSLPGVLI